MAANKERGSAQLIKDRFAHRTLREEDLLWIADIIDADGVDLLNFWVRGQPKPDVAGGMFRVEAGVLTDIVTQFAGKRNPGYQLSIYPRGMPSDGSGGSIVGFVTPAHIGPDVWMRGQPAPDVIGTGEPTDKR